MTENLIQLYDNNLNHFFIIIYLTHYIRTFLNFFLIYLHFSEATTL